LPDAKVLATTFTGTLPFGSVRNPRRIQLQERHLCSTQNKIHTQKHSCKYAKIYFE
jgi:hypothetical protein